MSANELFQMGVELSKQSLPGGSSQLLGAAQKLLDELKRLHGESQCLSPGNCRTWTAIREGENAIADERMRLLNESEL